MKIQFASDLHLEFRDNSRWLKDNPLIPVGDILVLAGDIGYLGDEIYNNHPFWNWCAVNFKKTFVVPGNHELYKGFDINDLTKDWELKVRDNIRVVYNQVLHYEDTDIICSTLWSEIPLREAYFTEKGVTDFRRIRDGERMLSWERFNKEHRKCVDFISKSIAESKAKIKIVVTHHVPSFQLMAAEFRGSMLNGAFTSNLDKIIESLPIDYWIYGHSHRNIEAEIAGTKMLTNQLGYVFANEHSDFNRKKFIDVDPSIGKGKEAV